MTKSEGSHRRAPWPVVGVVAVATLWFAACGTDKPNGAGDGTNQPQPYCALPNDGCDCDQPGRVLDCGTVKYEGPDGYLACAMGTRTCAGGKWSTCSTVHDVTATPKTFTSVRIQALGTAGPCPAGWNPCDPYCNMFQDDATGLVPDGGVTVGDGGLTIGSDGGSGSSGTFFSSAAGVTLCSPNRNITGPACAPGTPAALTTCQQDHRCDPVTSQCLWNGGAGYSDSAAAGIDLTVGAPCGPQGSAPSTVPVCNRGTVAVPAGSPITFHQTNGATPPDGCTNLGAPSFSFTLASALAPGACTSFSVSNSPGAKFITLNAGVPGSQPINEGAGRCANNSAYWKTDGSGGDCNLCTSTCATRLTGTIRDPRGVNPLPGINVFVPSTTPAALTDGVSCDTCASLLSGAPLGQAVTAFDGTFTLDVPPNATFPLVIQTGKWRRIVNVPAVTQCTTGTLAAALARLPKNSTEGNIPKTAVVMAQGDKLECLLRKIGIDDSQFTNAAGAGRIHVYTHNGLGFAGATNGPTNLWGNLATLQSYSALILPCDNNHITYPPPAVAGPNTTNPPNPTATAAQRANMKTYLDQGGRLFTSHWLSHDFVHLNWPAPTGPVGPEFGTNVDNDREAPSFPYTIDTTTPLGTTLSQWAPLVGAGVAGPPPKITFTSWRHLSKTVNTAGGAIRLTYGDSTQPPVSHPQNAGQWGGPHVNMYQFDTPWGVPPASQCGRVVVSQSHVSSAPNPGNFPAACQPAATAMTPQEKAFEFLLFSSQACIGPTPPPPAPPPLPSVTFVRDYEGVCGVGEIPIWQPMYWQANVPGGTNIKFEAGTADTQAALPPTSASPGVKVIGTAASTVAAPTWGCDGCPATPTSVDWHLKNDPPPPNTGSKKWLRVFITFTPNNGVNPPVAPMLSAWRQVFSCIPAE